MTKKCTTLKKQKIDTSRDRLLTIRLSEAELDFLQREAKRNDRSVSAEVRQRAFAGLVRN